MGVGDNGGWQGAGQGAIGGGLAGAGIGSMLMPGVGTAIGAGVGALGGGLMGYFGGGENPQDQQYRQMLMDYYNNAGKDQAGVSGFRENQSNLIKRLEAISSGSGPSLAAQQFKQATDQNIATQQAFAAGGRGGPMAALTAANNSSMLGARAAQGSALARTGEEQMALGQLGGAIGTGRAQDEALNIANMQAKMGAQQFGLSGLGGLNNRQAQTPTMGQQLMAGGAGMFAFGAGQRGQNPAGGGGYSPAGLGNYQDSGINSATQGNYYPGLFNPWGPNGPYGG